MCTKSKDPVDATTHSRRNTMVINVQKRKNWYMIELLEKEAEKNCKYVLKYTGD